MIMPLATLVLDNEAVQALQDPLHRKHRLVMSYAQVVATRKRSAIAIEIVVPAAVRVEAGWDRASRAWVLLNRLRIVDIPQRHHRGGYLSRRPDSDQDQPGMFPARHLAGRG